MNRRRKFSIAGIILVAVIMCIFLVQRVMATQSWPETGCVGCCSNCDNPPCCRCCGKRTAPGFEVRQLPHTYVPPADSCNDSMSGAKIRELPFYVDDERYGSIPAIVDNHKYCVEECHTHHNPCSYRLTIW